MASRFIKIPAAVLLALLLGGCAHKPGVGSYLDSGMTYVAMSNGGVELNPIIGWHPSPVVTALTAMGVKQGAKYTLSHGFGTSHRTAHRSVEAGGWMGFGATAAMAAGAVTGWGLVIGAFTGMGYLWIGGGL